MLGRLSKFEQSQLGTCPKSRRYPTADEWLKLREAIARRSCELFRRLKPDCTAFTPGETQWLMDNHSNVVRWWHESLEMPPRLGTTTIVLVPCGKGKPWKPPRAGLYLVYNRLVETYPQLQFVTISEPMGVIVDYRWADFPAYDCPGLFPEDAMRHSMEAWELERLGLPSNIRLPYDPVVASNCIERIGAHVHEWLRRHTNGRRVVAFCDNSKKPMSSHGKMLDIAMSMGSKMARYPKREGARVPPERHILTKLKLPLISIDESSELNDE